MDRSKVSLVLASQAPKKLAEFYSFVMDAEISPGLSEKHWLVIHPDGLSLQIYQPSQNSTLRPKAKGLALCIQGKCCKTPLIRLEEFVVDLVSRGAEMIESPKIEFFGAECWMSDPEGNCFLIMFPFNSTLAN